jgi:hypothetical protein
VKEFIPHFPHRLHVELVTGEDDLAALFVLAILEVARHVHPAVGLIAAGFVLLADAASAGAFRTRVRLFAQYCGTDQRPPHQ